ncbi:MAG: PilZ domain-containing protein [Spirochaetia bacterium]|nr:PilZ domain-containing protein [Spirochaetia bacterium]
MQNGDLYIERRKFKRVEKKCKVNYKVIRAEEETQEIRKAAVKSAGESYDISLGGLKVDGGVTGKVGDIIRLEIIMEGRTDPITTFAEIKWIKEDKATNSNSFGLEFLILKEADRDAIVGITG